jgi:hypothetical protein
VTWSSSKAKSKLWAHANEKNQRIEIDKNNSMNHGNVCLAHCLRDSVMYVLVFVNRQIRYGAVLEPIVALP